MPAYPATGLVINRRDLGEADKILVLYTQQFGKLSAVARGARRSGSRLSGATELFTDSRFLLATGKSLDIVTQCEISRSFPALRLDIGRLARATYFCELLNRLTVERDPSQSEELHRLTVSALELLEQTGDYPDAIVHAYELSILGALGYAPMLDRCVRCGAPLVGLSTAFSPSLGGALCSADRYGAEDAGALSAHALELLRVFELGDTAALLAAGPTAAVAAEVDRALRWVIRLHADRDLKSADFLDQLRASS